MTLPRVVSNKTGSLAELVLESHAPDQTEAFGRLLAEHFLPGDIVSLDGTLGAGKTLMTRGIARGLGCKILVSSPTFILLIEHPAADDGLALYHFDVYRLSGSDAFLAAGLDEYFDMDGVCVIEWGNLIDDILPDRTLSIQLETGQPDQPDRRRLALSWPGCPDRLAQLRQALIADDKEVDSNHADSGD